MLGITVNKELLFNLNNRELEICNIDGNIIIIGRSGTGKTTVLLRKLQIIYLLYNNYKNSYKFDKTNLIDDCENK